MDSKMRRSLSEYPEKPNLNPPKKTEEELKQEKAAEQKRQDAEEVARIEAVLVQIRANPHNSHKVKPIEAEEETQIKARLLRQEPKNNR